MDGMYQYPVKRKAMNTFFIRTSRPVPFPGRQNEDVNAYVCSGGRGDLFLTVTDFMVVQNRTQSVAGGMTALYLATGTYTKSMYSVMMAPSCVTVSTLGEVDHRIHHRVQWNNAVPKILSDRFRQ